MGLPGRAFLDPALQGGLLFGGDHAMALGRRHQVVGVRRDDPAPERGFRRIAGGEHRPFLLGTAVEAFLGVESETRLALAGVGSVAVEAVLRKDGADLAVEVDLLGCRVGRNRQREKHSPAEGGAAGDWITTHRLHRIKVPFADPFGLRRIHTG